MKRTLKRVAVVAALITGLVIGATPAQANRAKTYLVCGWEGHVKYGVKPRDCFLDWPNLDLAHAVNLHRIRWSSWGGPSARARAVWRIKTYEPWHKARVRAFRIRCSYGDPCGYTRVRVWFPNGYVHTWRTPTPQPLD